MEKFKKLLPRYLIALVIGAIFVFACISLREYSSEMALAERYKILADAFTIPGVVFILIGALVWVSTDGFFDMFSFAIGKAVKTLIPFSKRSDETFYDYKVRKSEDRITGYSFLFFTGLAFLIVSIVLLVLYLKA